MDETRPVVSFVAILVLLALSAFFSGSETALMSFRKVRLKHLVHKGHKKAILVDKLLKETDRVLGTILVGNNLVNVAASVLSGALAAQLLEPKFGKETAMFAATLCMTVLLLIFAEITPKTLSAYHSEEVSFLVARPIQWLGLALSPLVTLTTWFARFILRVLFRVKPMSFQISAEEIRSMITYSAKEGVLETDKKEMLHGIFDISKTLVKEVMLPRPDIVAIESGTPIQEILQTIQDTGHSRYPVYQGQIDNISGFLFVKDLIPYWSDPQRFDLKEVLRKASYVPETKRVDQLIAEFRKEQRQVSIVADEYGGVAGLVTMEDLLEEITGEIQDEYDQETEKIERLPDGSLVFDGSLPLDELYEETGIRLPEGEYETIAGFLLDIFGKIPKESEAITFGHHLITVQKMVRHRIVKVKMKPLNEATIHS